MSLQDRLNEQKQSTTRTTGKNSDEILSEVIKQNDLMRKKMLQIEDEQNRQNKERKKYNQNIKNLVGKLETATMDWNSKVDKATEKVSEDLLITQKRAYNEIKENFKKQNNLNQKFHKVQGFSFFALSIIAMVLLIALIARTLAIGVWEGLFLSQLWNLEGWYWSALAAVILVALIAGVIVLIIRGISDLRY